MKRGIDMKKSTMLAFTAAAIMSVASVTGYAAGAPTYDDNLILKNPIMTPSVGSVVLVPVASPANSTSITYIMWMHGEMQKLITHKLKLSMIIMKN